MALQKKKKKPQELAARERPHCPAWVFGGLSQTVRPGTPRDIPRANLGQGSSLQPLLIAILYTYNHRLRRRIQFPLFPPPVRLENSRSIRFRTAPNRPRPSLETLNSYIGRRAQHSLFRVGLDLLLAVLSIAGKCLARQHYGAKVVVRQSRVAALSIPARSPTAQNAVLLCAFCLWCQNNCPVASVPHVSNHFAIYKWPVIAS